MSAAVALVTDDSVFASVSQLQPTVPTQVADAGSPGVVVARQVVPFGKEPEAALPSIASTRVDARSFSYEHLEPVIALPPPRERATNLLPLQQWEGVVTEVLADGIVCTLRDLTHPEHPQEEATVPLEEVPREDRRLLAPGAVLYWNIGYQTLRASGQVQRVSDIRLRRLPAWSRRDLERVAQRAAALREMFATDDPDDATGSR